MILKFDDFVRINEGVESVVSFSELKRYLDPLGWTYKKTKNGYIYTKGGYVVTFHRDHAKKLTGKADIGGLDDIRNCMLDDFYKTGNMTDIKAIPWEKWRLKDPFKKELKDYNPETGQKIEVEPELNMGQRLNQARVEKNKSQANELYKDASLWKIDYEDENSAYIICYNGLYNTCKSEDDRTPLLKNWNPTLDEKSWTPYYQEKDGIKSFGKENWKKQKVEFRKVLSDGTLDNHILKESKINKNLNKIW